MSKRLAINNTAPRFRLNDPKGNAVTLDSFKGKAFALLFTRYVGCPVCQMDTIEFKKQYHNFVDAGLEVVMIFQSTPERLREFSVHEVLPFPTLSDVKGVAYESYGVSAGLLGFFSVKNISPIMRSLRSGHKHGKFEGNEFQYPAAFIIDEEQKVRHVHYGKTVTDSIDPIELLSIYRNNVTQQ